MNRRAFAISSLLAVPALTSALSQDDAPPAPQADHVAWVVSVIHRMSTITVGMTRADLLTVFTTEGGMPSRLQRTYVSRDCRYFKIDVQFRAVGADQDSNGRGRLVEDPRDVIVRISRPFLQLAIDD